MCGSKVNSYTGCGHTLKVPWTCRPVRDSGQPLCRDWDSPTREHPQAPPQNCPDCDRRPLNLSRWREIGIQPQDPVLARIGSVADRYVPTPPPPPPVSRYPSGYRHVEDSTRAGAGAEPTPSEIGRRIVDWGRGVPHPTGYDTRYTPPSPDHGVYRRSSSQENIHSSSRAGSSASRQHHHHRHRSSRAEHSAHHQSSSSSRIGSSATHHEGSRLEHTSRQSSRGSQLYNPSHQSSESHRTHQPSIRPQQALIPRPPFDVGHVHPRYDNADEYTRHLSEHPANISQQTRTLPMHSLSAARSAPSVTDGATSQRYILQHTRIVQVTRTTLTRISIYRAAPQPAPQPDPSDTGPGLAGGVYPAAVRRGAGSHGGSGGLSYLRGPAPGPGPSRRFY